MELFARAVSESINRFILSRLAGDARIVPLRALAEGSPYSSDYLRQLALSVGSAPYDTGHCGSAPGQRSRSTWTAEVRAVADDPRTLKNENRTQTTQDASSFTAPSISHIPR